MSSLCAADAAERRVAHLVTVYGQNRYTGPWAGCITLTTQALDVVADVLNTHGYDLDRRLCCSATRFKLARNLWHADALWCLLRESDAWPGHWRHVCDKLSWFRPDIAIADEEDEACAAGTEPEPDSESEVVMGLRRELGDAHAKIEALKAKVRALQQVVRRSRAKEAATAMRPEATVEAQREAEFKRGSGQRFFSVRGGLALALRRCVAKTTCSSLGLAMGTDMHRTTVARWELALRASRLSMMRAFYAAAYRSLEALGDDEAEDEAACCSNAYSIATHCMECDATNSGLWKKTHKLHSLKVRSSFVTMRVRMDSRWAEVQANLHEKEMMGDLQLVKVISGFGALGMMHKQILSLGNRQDARVIAAPLPLALQDLQANSGYIPIGEPVSHALTRHIRLECTERAPLYSIEDGQAGEGSTAEEDEDDGLVAERTQRTAMFDDSDRGDPVAMAPVESEEVSAAMASSAVAVASTQTDCDAQDVKSEQRPVHIKNTLNVWAVTTDAGSDEVKARRLRLVSSSTDLAHWEFSSDCFAHQFQLLVMNQLRWMDWLLTDVLCFSGKYWATLAKIMHTWRDKASDVYLAYVSVCGGGAADAHAAQIHKIPPRPLVGRWGSVSACQKRLVLAQCDRLLKALRALGGVEGVEGGKSKRSAAAASTSTGVGAVDELSSEEIKFHQENG